MKRKSCTVDLEIRKTILVIFMWRTNVTRSKFLGQKPCFFLVEIDGIKDIPDCDYGSRLHEFPKSASLGCIYMWTHL